MILRIRNFDQQVLFDTYSHRLNEGNLSAYNICNIDDFLQRISELL